MTTPPRREDSDRQFLPTLSQGYASPKSTGLQQDQMQTCAVAPMATPTTNRILQKQQPLEILYTESGRAEPRRRTLRTNHGFTPLSSPKYRRNVAPMKDA
jgi:hypothetical protein